MTAALDVPRLPAASGAYRWLYTDVTAGEWTCVCIFLVGSVFSPRYAARWRRGAGPLEHCAVNLALYERGVRRAWAFTEYAGANVVAGRTLAIGASRLAYADDGTLAIDVRDRTAPWGRPIEASLTLAPRAACAPEVAIDAGGVHRWQARVPRAAATLVVPALGLHVDGLGYHDTNHGTEPLGGALRGWQWTRVHGPRATAVCYRPAPGGPSVHLTATAERTTLRRSAAREPPLRRTPWGLAVPTTLDAGGAVWRVRHRLESSPFYARQEGGEGAVHALGEVADFRRFRSPRIRWMARFRMRVAA